MMSRVVVIPAAGAGSRLGVPLKPLYPLLGSPMILRVVRKFVGLAGRVVIVASPEGLEPLRRAVGGRMGSLTVSYAVQAHPDGMLGAVAAAESFVRPDTSEVWVTWCDQVLVTRATLLHLAEALEPATVPAALPTVLTSDAYTHIKRDMTGRVVRVQLSREGDLMPYGVGCSDVGVFGFKPEAYQTLCRVYREGVVPRGLVTGEVNLLTALTHLPRVQTVPISDPREAWGVNTPEEAVRAERRLSERLAENIERTHLTS